VEELTVTGQKAIATIAKKSRQLKPAKACLSVLK
jgi:hypothetical protein